MTGGLAKPVSGSGSMRVRQVVVLTTAMLTFIPFWQAAAVVLCDLGSSVFYAGGIAFQSFGPAFPWYVLAVMIYCGAMLAVYLESCAMFVRGGVYRVVKEGMGDSMAKVAVSALIFDFVLTGPISAVSAGHYLSGLLSSLFPLMHIGWHLNANIFAVVFAALATLFFWRQNIRGIEESSSTSSKIIYYVIAISAITAIGAILTMLTEGFHIPPTKLEFRPEALGWAKGVSWLAPIGAIGVIMAFGHSILSLSGLETMAQVYREIEAPKMENLKKAAITVFIFALAITGFLTFLAAAVIPPDKIAVYQDNLIAGLTMELYAPFWLRMTLQALVVIGGVVILSGAINTAIIGSNGVLNRVAEDGVLADWFRHLHPKYGTTHRIINMVVMIQLGIILLCGGNVYLLGEAYAFGLIWSFVFTTASVIILRFKDHSKREWMVPFNIKIGNTYVPIGIILVALVLVAVAVSNLITKRIATISGVIFTGVFFVIFYISEKINERNREDDAEPEEKLNSKRDDDLFHALTELDKPERVLVAVRNPDGLYHFEKIMAMTDADTTDIIVMYCRVPSPMSFSDMQGGLLPDERNVFTRVILTAEKHGRTVFPILLSSNDPFYAMSQLAYAAKASRIVMGVSGVHGADAQLERLAMAWGAIKANTEKPITAAVLWQGREMSCELT